MLKHWSWIGKELPLKWDMDSWQYVQITVDWTRQINLKSDLKIQLDTILEDIRKNKYFSNLFMYFILVVFYVHLSTGEGWQPYHPFCVTVQIWHFMSSNESIYVCSLMWIQLDKSGLLWKGIYGASYCLLHDGNSLWNILSIKVRHCKWLSLISSSHLFHHFIWNDDNKIAKRKNVVLINQPII